MDGRDRVLITTETAIEPSMCSSLVERYEGPINDECKPHVRSPLHPVVRLS
jgi:hypothetical protein